ncbi:hypothetical protein PYCC9005_003735 [Savitreella phatthalungensis]
MSDDDFCRVCRSEGTTEEPLFHPCKCSGSIRYVHEACLKEWLQHSQKQHCELCKTPFRFTKLYDPQMPSRIPFVQLVRNMSVDVASASVVLVRWLLCAWVWLLWLPYCTRHIWRTWLTVGDAIVNPKLFPNSTSLIQESLKVAASHSALAVLDDASAINGTLANDSFVPFNVDKWTRYPVLNRLITDILEGQIITSSIIAVFVVAFLIREWLVVNNANLMAEQAGLGDGNGQVAVAVPPVDPFVFGEDVMLQGLAVGPLDARARVFEQERVRRIGDLFVERGRLAFRESVPSPLIDPGVFRGNSSIYSHSPELDHQHIAAEHQLHAEVTAAADSWQPPPVAQQLTTAEVRALRRQAALSAATRRREVPERSNRPVNRTETATNGMHTPDRAVSSAYVPPSGPRTRFRAARERSAERRAWENRQEELGDRYPDSPMPLPRQDIPEPDRIELSETYRGRSPSPMPTSSISNPYLRREVEIAATSSSASGFRRDAATPEPTLASASQLNFAERMNAYWAANTLAQRRDMILLALDWSCGLIEQKIDDLSGELDENDSDIQEYLRRLEVFARLASRAGITEEELDFERIARAHSLLPAARAVVVDAQAQIRLHFAQHALPAANDPAPLQIDAREAEGDGMAMQNNNPEDDIEGLLELIGVRGPLVALFQNSMLVIVLVLGFVFFGVCLPYVLGSVSIRLLSEPYTNMVARPAYIMGLFMTEFLRATHLMTKPIIEHSRLIKYGRLLFERIAASDVLNEALISADVLMRRARDQVLRRMVIKGPDADEIYRTLTNILAEIPPRVLAVSSGYVTASLLGALYVRANIRLLPGHLDEIVRAIVRQAGYVLKFVTILGIELCVFPCYCGALLDLVLLPLFNASPVDRLRFALNHPFTSLYLHWFFGTSYMFSFALFVSMCRGIVRPGLLFFIRDPNDPAFNPIKDILERSLLSQMRKIGISVLIYGALLVFGFGSAVWAAGHIVTGLSPLRLGVLTSGFEAGSKGTGGFSGSGILPSSFNGSAFTAGGLEQIVMQLLLPLAMRLIDVVATYRGIWRAWFMWSAASLRLSSFIMGDRHVDEERVSPLLRSLGLEKASDDGDFNGSFRRVPATDTLPVRIGPGQHMLIEVDEHNERQDGQPEDDTREDAAYMVVYAPPHFRLRLGLFMLGMWLFAGIMVLFLTVLPIALGRRLSGRLFPGQPVNDLTNYGYGSFALIVVCGTITKLAKAARPERQLPIEGLVEPVDAPAPARQGNENHDQQNARDDAVGHAVIAAPSVLDFFAPAIFLAKWSYIFLLSAIIMPLLCGICLEAYVVMPLATWLEWRTQPTFHFFNDWVHGLLAIKFLASYGLAAPNSWVGHALVGGMLRGDRRHGWRDPDIAVATRRLFGPIVGAAAMALLLPLCSAYTAERIFFQGSTKMSPELHNAIYRISYPACLLGASVLVLLGSIRVLLARWSQRIRDDLYLKGNLLHNYQEDVPARVGHA